MIGSDSQRDVDDTTRKSSADRCDELLPRRYSRRQVVERSAIGVAGLAAGGLLSSCGSSESRQAGNVAAGNIRFLKFPHSPTDLAFQKRLAADFMEKHPKIKVSAGLYDIAARDTALTAAYASPNPPDVTYQSDNSWVRYAAAGALLDVTERVKDPSFQDTYNAIPEKYWQQVTYDGKIYGVPVAASLYSQIVNLELLKRANVAGLEEGTVSASPWSWSDMRSAAQRVTRDDTFGFSSVASAQELDWAMPLTYLYSNGGDVLTADGAAGAVDTPQAAEAFDLLRAIVAEDRSAPRPGLFKAEGLKGLFKAGRLAIYHDSAVIFTLATQKLPFEWQARPIPAGPGGPPAGYAALGAYFLAAKTQAADAAFSYAAFLASPESVLKWFEKTFNRWDVFPARTDISDRLWSSSDDLQAASRAIFDEIFVPLGKGLPIAPQGPAILRALGSEYEELLLNRQNGEQMAANADEEISRLVAS